MNIGPTRSICSRSGMLQRTILVARVFIASLAPGLFPLSLEQQRLEPLNIQA